ncbi:hypothetical protein B4U79_15088 [Dinothrombium tinctorium]|uniref:Spaetzle domain-containing protein n=1 Tax=Dinothrombium tinctorium TaxID=1965070 RepID=A0A3S3SC22_9ACAR|nr:hypothetical protein B4U79_15088 [Dinothrombium tinctorium]
MDARNRCSSSSSASLRYLLIFLLPQTLVALLSFATSFVAGKYYSSAKSDSVAGFPCIRRSNQLYCPTPGKRYPSDVTKSPLYVRNRTTTIFYTEIFAENLVAGVHFNYSYGEGIDVRTLDAADETTTLHFDRVLKRVKRDGIDTFIEENKALVRRMFGEYAPPEDNGYPDAENDHYSSYDGSSAHKRPKRARSHNKYDNKVDSCESAVEIVTPYWASNSAGKIRAIVNTQHLQQAIQQEVCQSSQTKRCNSDCSCEQKYKWHRLLAYDPDDDCKGIFMDWFLFPSCCTCRCVNVLTKS